MAERKHAEQLLDRFAAMESVPAWAAGSATASSTARWASVLAAP